MASKLYRLRYATPGATTVAGNVDGTITSAQLASVPTIPGPIARPLDGKTEAQPWSVTMLSSAIHGDIADANGRLDLGGRLCDWSESTDDGATYTVLWTGRLTGLSSPDPATLKATLEDERFLERRSVIFATNKGTVQICPPGPRSQWGRHPVRSLAGRTATMRVTEVDGTDAVHLEWKDGWTCSRGALDFVASDGRADADPRKDQGNFTHTRLNIAGTDREIITFALGRNGHDLAGNIEDENGGPSMWVHWPAHGLSQWDNVDDCFLYAPTAPPTPDLPLLIGGATGVTDAQLAQDIYDGDYGATDEGGNPVAIRYDATAFAALDGKATWFVVEGPENMAAWVEEHIYKPRQWVPFVNAWGEVAPKSTALARDIDYTALTTLTTSNVLGPYPEWDYAARDTVTSLKFEVRRHYWIGGTGALPDGDFPSSLITWRTQTEERDHDNISSMGRVSRTIAINRDAGGPRIPLLDAIAREYFERVGDGVIRLPALRTSEALEAGEIVTLDSDTLKLPNPNTNARTGDSIWQALKVDRLPGAGFAVELGYAGPSQQKLAAPTVSAALSASVPQHLVDVTISGLGTGEGYVLEADRGNGAGWVHAATGSTNETVTIGGCPSGTAVSFRALTTKRNRIRSAYSTTASVTTNAIPAPSLFTGTVDGTTVAGDWTNGSDEYDVMPTLDGADVLSGPLEAGSDAFVWQGLSAGATHTLGVKHVDAYGGESALTTLSITTGTKGTLTAPSGLGVVQGRESAYAAPPIVPLGMNVGIEIAWDNAGEGAAVEWQVSTSSAFTTVLREGLVENSGQRVGRVVARTGFRKDALYVRVRHTGEGYTDSAWSDTVSTFATFLKSAGGPRKVEFLANTDAGATASVVFSSSNEATVQASAPAGTSNIYITVGVDTDPPDPSSSSHDGTISGSSGRVNTGVVVAEGSVAHVKVRADSGTITTFLARNTEGGTITASISFNSTNETVVTANGPSGTTALYITVGADTEPADPTTTTYDGVINDQSGTVNTGVVVAEGSIAYVRIAPYDGSTLGDVVAFSASNAAAKAAPVAYLSVQSQTSTATTVQYDGSDGTEGRSVATAYQRRIDTMNESGSATIEGTWGAWTATLPDTETIARDVFFPKTVHLRVRDADNRESDEISIVVPPTLPSHDRITGKVDLAEVVGELLEDHIADNAVTQVKMASGLFVPEIVATLPTLPNASYPDGATVVLNTDWKLYRNASGTWTVEVEGSDIVANTITAAQIAAGAIGVDELAANAITAEKIQVGTLNAGQNLLTRQWGEKQDQPASTNSTLIILTETFSLDDLDLSVGDVISFGAEYAQLGSTDSNAGFMRVQFLDIADGLLETHNTPTTGTASWVRVEQEDVTIPASAAQVRVQHRHTSSPGHIVSARRAMLNRGPVALPFEQPPFRINREIIDANVRIADGVITALKIDVAQLDDIADDLGIIVSGVLRNSGNTAGIRIDSADTLPSVWNSYLDLGASGGGAVLKHNKLSLNADGTANWAPEVENPPSIEGANVTASDNGIDDVYSATWGVSDAVTASYTIRIRYYKNGSLVHTKAGITATDLSDSHTETGAGDGTSDDHNADLQLFDGSGNAVGGLVETLERPSTT